MQRDTDRLYWERHAAKYDRTMGPLGKPLPRMLERVAHAVRGRERVLEVAAGTGLVTAVHRSVHEAQAEAAQWVASRRQ